MKEERINEIWALFLLAVSLLIFASLISVDFYDLGLYTSSPNSPVKNFAGIIGAYLAGFIIFFAGKTGFIIPALTSLWAIGMFAGRTVQRFYIKLIGSLTLILAASSLASIASTPEESVRFLNGGLVGLGFSTFLDNYFGQGGAYIILVTLVMLSMLLATDFLLFPFLSAAFKRMRRLTDVFKKAAALLKPKTAPAKQETISFEIKRPVVVVSRPKVASRPIVPPQSKPVKIPQIKITPRPEPKPVEKAETVRPAATEPATSYILPSVELLNFSVPGEARRIEEDIKLNSKILEDTLSDFELEVKVVNVEQGPVITRYELEPAPGIRIASITSLSDNIALAMKAVSVRIVAPIPGKGTVGVEVPNSKSELVYLRDIIESQQFQDDSSRLAIALGKNISGEPVIADLADMPHLLIAGTTGSGKTVCVNSLVASLLFRYGPDELKFIMVDPKKVELATFNGLPHLLCPVVTEAKKVSSALNWVVNEMESRYELFAKSGSRNVDIYNEKMAGENQPKLPYIIVIIDELADLMAVAQNDIENAITRLAQLSRAVGIHIILATQRPSVDVITGIIKANFPARISFKVASKVDSRTVLDTNGADKLLGRGDMLFIEPGTSRPIRAQASLVSDDEISRLVEFIKSQREVRYNDEILSTQKKAIFKQFEKDEVYEEAVKLILQTRQASVSMLQRRLGLGYTRAARIIDMMEDEGIVGPYMGSKPRDILVENLEAVKKDNEAKT